MDFDSVRDYADQQALKVVPFCFRYNGILQVDHLRICSPAAILGKGYIVILEITYPQYSRCTFQASTTLVDSSN